MGVEPAAFLNRRKRKRRCQVQDAVRVKCLRREMREQGSAGGAVLLKRGPITGFGCIGTALRD